MHLSWLSAYFPDGCWKQQANKILLSSYLDSFPLLLGYSREYRKQWLLKDAGPCNIDFQICLGTALKSIPKECDLFPLKCLLKPLAKNQDPILFPFLSIITPWSDICDITYLYVYYFSLLVEFKL